MKNNKRLIAPMIEIALGIVLCICYWAQLIDDYWSGMGFALFVVGVLQLIRQIRYRTDKSYQESVDVRTKDERNRYLGMKAWAWAGYWFVILSAIASILLRIAGQNQFSLAASGCVCLILILYCLSYLCLSKKY